MGRPAGPSNYNRRLKAYEMFAAGVKKIDIARELAVTRGAVNSWAKKDNWDERFGGAVAQAELALTHSMGNEVANTLAKLRGRLANRLIELEVLCGASSPAATRLSAIKTWMNLAGIGQRAIPNPLDPTTPKSIELIEDLVAEPTGSLGGHDGNTDITSVDITPDARDD